MNVVRQRRRRPGRSKEMPADYPITATLSVVPDPLEVLQYVSSDGGKS